MARNLSPDGDIKNSTTLFTNHLHVSKACSFGISSLNQREIDPTNTIVAVEVNSPYTLIASSNISAITGSDLYYNKLNNTITLYLDISFTQSGGGSSVVLSGLPEQSASNITTLLYSIGSALPNIFGRVASGSSNLTLLLPNGVTFTNGNSYRITGIISYESNYQI